MHQGKTTFTTEEIEIHVRTYRSLLKASGSLNIEKLIDSHNKMRSILHEKGSLEKVDLAAFIYVLLRLPFCMSNVNKIILGQSFDVFKKHKFPNIKKWKEVGSPGRRRKMFYNGRDTLAIYIASVTDVDDLITLLTAFQIEWNKFNKILSKTSNIDEFIKNLEDKEAVSKIRNIWGDNYHKFLTAVKKRKVDFTVDLLAGSYVEYAKATQQWWKSISSKIKHLRIDRRPIYFVSSNTHSITNLLTRFATFYEKEIIDFLYKSGDETLIKIWEEIKKGNHKTHKDHFLYYMSKKYQKENPNYHIEKERKEKALGLNYIPSSYYLDIDAQIIEIKSLAKAKIDGRIGKNLSSLSKSDAVIINIDYPLGWAAYQILTEIGQNVSEVKGLYIMGKAATLNGQIGDILLSNTVFDQHTKNIYTYDNAITASDFKDIFLTGMVLDGQKTVAAKGTFLENANLIKNWYREGYSVVEMESGPYLNAIYEFLYYNRYVENEFISLINPPFDIGIAHYSSDTPYSKAKNLGVRNLSYEGVESTYAISLVILRKIVEKELKTIES